MRRNEPPIPEGITGTEISGDVKGQLRQLDKDNAKIVAKHLVAAGAYFDTDLQQAYLHAKAAVDRAGRIGAVREALGLVAYRLDMYDEAVRELRTHRRITGSNDNLAVIADAERGRGRAAKAVEMYTSTKDEELEDSVRVELAIVAAGALSDQDKVGEGRKILEAIGFMGHDALTTVRMLSAFSEVLRIDGEDELADKYEELSRRTAKSHDLSLEPVEPDPNADVEIITIEELTDEEIAGLEEVTGESASNDEDAEETSEASESEDLASAEAEIDAEPAEEATEVPEESSEATESEESTSDVDESDDVENDAAVNDEAESEPADASATGKSFQQDVEDEVAELLGEIDPEKND